MFGGSGDSVPFLLGGDFPYEREHAARSASRCIDSRYQCVTCERGRISASVTLLSARMCARFSVARSRARARACVHHGAAGLRGIVGRRCASINRTPVNLSVSVVVAPTAYDRSRGVTRLYPLSTDLSRIKGPTTATTDASYLLFNVI